MDNIAVLHSYFVMNKVADLKLLLHGMDTLILLLKSGEQIVTWKPEILAVGQLRWDLPGQVWSGADRYDETIRVLYAHGSWSAFTECNQCVHRDLDESEIAAVRAEFALDLHLENASKGLS